MESVLLKDINEILKNLPDNILERVLGYVHGIVENESKDFDLTSEQKESLDKIKNRNYKEHTEIETFLNEMNSKYGL